MQKFVLFDGFREAYGIYLREALSVVILAGLFATLHLISYRAQGLAQRIARVNNLAWCSFIAGGLFLLMLMAPSRSPEFIYFQF